MQDVLFVLTWQSSQTRSQRRWQGTYTFLHTIASRELVDTHLATYETWLVYVQKITEHNEPFMPALMKASTYITVHYRNDIHALSHCMDNVQPRTPSVWMECILASHIRHAECTHIKHVATSLPMTRREDGIRGMDHSINPRNSWHAAQHTYETRGSLVWLCKKVSLT
jgi:hypothetical protein